MPMPDPGQLGPYLLIAALLGVVSEALAWRLGLWLYNRPGVRVFNILVTFGLIYGGLGYGLAEQGFVMQFTVGAALGLVNEAVNDRYIRAWYFPGRSVPWLQGPAAVVVIGLLWGLVPPIVVLLHGLIL